MNSEIKMVRLSDIKSNPFRQHSKYPYNPDKIAALRRSIKDVGLWEGVMGRKGPGGFIELSFGHHRIEAAKKELGSDAKVAIIVRDLDDMQMIQFFGRENLEDYNANFLVMLESWEGGRRFLSQLSRAPATKPEDIEIARLLGWTRLDANPRGTDRLNEVATACSNASPLLKGGYLNYDDLQGLSVDSVRRLTQRLISHHQTVEKMAKVTKQPTAATEKLKTMTSKAATTVAKQVREGKVAPRDIGGQMDVESYRVTKQVKETPLFKAFAGRLIEQIAKVAKEDPLAARFHEIKKSLNVLSLDEDVNAVQMIGMACGHASARFAKWQQTFADPRRKVVSLKEVAHDRR